MGATVWRWDQAEPFGNSPADENPSGLGAFDLPLRLPGQRYDAETGLHYNYFRDYDASLGIYGQSDPIGLRGGVNTYSYVAGSPLTRRDRFGLEWVLANPGSPSNTIACRGENITILLEDPFNDFYKCTTINQCRKMHEKVHVTHVIKEKPNICVGNTGLKWIANDSDADRLSSELRAFVEQLFCLKSALGASCVSPPCESEIRVNIRTIENTSIPAVKSGRY